MTGQFAPVFVSHGAPTLLLDDVPARDFLAGLGDVIGRPKAIVAVSAHWETEEPVVGAPQNFATIHDFYGFPPELYRLSYTPPGQAELAATVAERLTRAGHAVGIDTQRGLDHGAWVPLKLAYPAADIPVVSLSIQAHRDPAHHVAVGRALAGLADDDILVLASGSATHNLRVLEWGRDTPAAWASEFEGWLAERIAQGDVTALTDYRGRAPHAVRAHPRDEHLLPLFVALGAAGDAARGRRLHGSFTHGSLSMAAYGFW